MFAESTKHSCVKDEFGEEAAAIRPWSHGFRSQTVHLVNKAPSLRQSSTLLRRWDDEIEDLARQMLEAKRHRNTHALPCLLPAEVLAYIFEILSAIDPVPCDRCRWAWVCVTHVCHRFRAVALEHAKLWTTVSVDEKAWSWEFFIPRSRHLPLSVQGNAVVSNDILVRFIKGAFQPNIMRVHNLKMAAIPRDSAGPWLHALQKGAPALQVLSLTTLLYPPGTGEPELEIQTIPGSPSLRDLSLCGIKMCWNVIEPVQLRSLVLHSLDPDESSYTFEDVLRGLQCMPMLELLHLHDALPFDEAASSSTHISLPHLRILFIEDTDRRGLTLWSCLTISATCSVYVEIEALEDEDDAIIIALTQGYLAQRRPLFEYINVGDEGKDTDVIRFSAHLTDASVARTGHGGPPHTYSVDQDTILSIAFQALRRTEIILPLLSSFASESVKEISITEPSYSIPHLIGDIIRKFPLVESIMIIGSQEDCDQALAQKFCESFDQSFSPQTPQPVGELGTQCFLPRLRYLTMRGLDFEFLFTDGRPMHNNLTRAFQRRAAAGLCNPVLKLDDCIFRRSWLAQWSNEVEVHYDKISCEAIDDSVSDNEESASSSGSIA